MRLQVLDDVPADEEAREVGEELDAGADLAEGGGLFEERDGGAGAGDGDGGGEAPMPAPMMPMWRGCLGMFEEGWDGRGVVEVLTGLGGGVGVCTCSLEAALGMLVE